MKREKNLETALVLCIALIILYLILNKDVLLFISAIIGFIGILINPVAGIIHRLWYKLSEVLGFIISKIVLSIVFFLVLLPISMLYKLFAKSPLQLKKRKETYWISKEHKYIKEDLVNSW
ncbi:MAG: hypothetical protein K8S00_11565 [Bacteroidales bacterium]|nr:hypothetical protein [Bacteroidales bacterium]